MIFIGLTLGCSTDLVLDSFPTKLLWESEVKIYDNVSCNQKMNKSDQKIKKSNNKKETNTIT